MPKHFSNSNRGRARHQRQPAPGNRKAQQHGPGQKGVGGPNRSGQAALGRGSRDQQQLDKRPSVFDRLGVKRVNQAPGTNFPKAKAKESMVKAKPYRNSASGHGSASKIDHASNRPSTSTSNRRERGEYESSQLRPQSRTRSVSPRSKRNSATISTQQRKDDVTSSIPRHPRPDKSQSKTSGKRQGSSLLSKSQGTKPHNDKSKPKDGLRTGKSSETNKVRPSNSSQGTSSRSSSTSRSSSSSATSSSSSTSESSAPSIKLKTEKKEKSGKPSNKSKSTQPKKESAANKPKTQPESSSGSPGSVYVIKHVDGSRPSPAPRGHRRDQEFQEQRPLKSELPPMDRLMDVYRRSRDRDRPPSRTDRPRSNSRMRFDEPNRKRKLSGESFGSAGKRSRVRTPSPTGKYKGTPKKTPPSPRRNESPLVRDRNRPPSRDHMRIIQSSPKRPAYDDPSSRNEPRGRDRDSGNNRFLNSPRTKEVERPFSASSFAGSTNSPNFTRDRDRDEKRPRERLAPARNPTPLLPRERIPPPNPDRPPPLHDFESLRRAPLLPYPLIPEQGRPPFQQQRRAPFDEPRRNPPLVPARRRSPMIVKTKEALIEKYEDINKKSRVDLWVDETVKGNRGGPSNAGGIIPKMFALSRGSALDFDKKFKDKESPLTLTKRGNSKEKSNKDKETIVPAKAVKEKEPAFEPLDEVLSEISEDDDEILTKEVEKVESTETEPDITTTKLTPKAEDKLSEKDSDVANAKVSSSDNTIGEDVTESKSVKSEVTLMPPPTETTATRDRELQSHTQSHSQTDDDILEQMDFEEISDDELDNVESNKIGIVDALGVDWSSLVCRDKMKPRYETEDVSTSSHERCRIKEIWTPANIFKQIGLSRSLVSDKLFQKVLSKVEEMETRCGITDKTTAAELENPLLRRRRIERLSCVEKYGLGPASRALSARRDLSLRRYLLDLPPKPLVSLELGQS